MIPTSRASSASSNSIPPGPSEPSSIPIARNADEDGQAGAGGAERDDDAAGQDRADQQEQEASSTALSSSVGLRRRVEHF